MESRDGVDPRPGEPVITPPVRRFEPGTQLNEHVTLVRELGAGGMGAVWLADHAALGTRVAVKLLHHGAAPAERDRLLREARLTATVEHPNAVRVLETGLAPDGSPMLVLELVEGEPLNRRIAREGRLPLADVARLVAQVAGVLGAAHAKGVVHRDIKPANVMLVSGAGELTVKVVDFGIARPAASDVTRALTLPGALVGTLRYMAPEQLIDGKPVDAGADLWALGVVAYEALVGEPPFRGPTLANLCAAMILNRWERPSRVDEQIPRALDAWFEQALAMERQARPPSASELAASFERATQGEAAPEGRAPRPVTLRIPDRLFGREREIGAVLAAFERAGRGRSRVLFVTGYSGIGKTSLVAAVEPTLTAAGATFVSGKFDQFNRTAPYDSFIRALRRLIRAQIALVGGPPTAISGARGAGAPDDAPRTSKALLDGTLAPRLEALAGQPGQALIEVIPELEQLIGPQPRLDPVSPEEGRNRFRVAVERLVSSLATKEHPLVLFFDDLQWADLASIDLIANLATDPESRHVLFVGAYRDNEIHAAHPLTAALERLESAGSVEHVSLGPLGEDAVLDLVSAVFPGASGRARLAAICHQKTHGNALFLRRLLEALALEGRLQYDSETRQWSWDLATIEARAVTEDVVDFVAAEIRRMPAETSRAVAAAACIGDVFDLEVLGVALGSARAVMLSRLRPALASELVVPAPEETELATDPNGDAGRMTFRFAHDRLRQAARTLLDDDAAAEVRLRVARFMLTEFDDAELERRLFELVDHLNAGLPNGPATVERDQVRALNLRAARRATRSAAFEPAYGYLRRALGQLDSGAWESDYEQTFAMHVEGARAAYLSGQHDAMAALVETAAKRSRSVLDRVRAREVELQALVGQQRLLDVVRLSVSLCGELGLELPSSPTAEEVQRVVAETVALLEGIESADIARIPNALDERVVAIMRIQNATMSSAYLAVPNLLPIMSCNIVRMTIESGVCPQSPYGFAVLGLVLSAANQFDAAYRIGKLATDLLGRVEDRSVHPRTLHVVSSFVRPFIEPMRASIEAARQVFRLGMDVGDFEYAAWGLHTLVRDGMFGGLDLEELEPMYERAMGIVEHQRQVAAIAVCAPFVQLLSNLRGRAADPSRLVGPSYDEVAALEALRAIDYRGAVFVLSVLGAYARFVFRDLPAAQTSIEVAAPYADSAVATYNQVWFHQLRALTRLGLTRHGASDAEAALGEIEPDLTQLRIWQRFCPENHDHRVHLVEAEMARVSGSDEAGPLYDRAIERAKANGFAPELAIATELAYRHHDACGDAERASAYFARALDAYERWGATAKVERLRGEPIAAR